MAALARASLCTRAAAGTDCSRAVLLRGPPLDYDHRAALKARSAELVAARHPELLPLVAEGTLVALQRSADYCERREDGYLEPETIFLVGTAHVSRQSAQDVRSVVAVVRPDAVVVELCRSRQAVLALQEPEDAEHERQGQPQPQFCAGDSRSGVGAGSSGRVPGLLSLSGDQGLLPTYLRSLALGGSSAILLRLLLARLSEGLSGRLGGVRPGVEMAAAAAAARDCGATLVLGDRPIEITLRRAWDALPWRRRLPLLSALVAAASGAAGTGAGGGKLLDSGVVERLKDDDAISAMFQQMGQTYPEARQMGAASASARVHPAPTPPTHPPTHTTHTHTTTTTTTTTNAPPTLAPLHANVHCSFCRRWSTSAIATWPGA